MPRIPLPAKFEDGDLPSFRKSFERVAKANGWTEEEQLWTLPLALANRALVAFERKESNIKSIADAFKVLEEEFNSARDREAAMKEFYSCQWGVGLDPDVYATKLKRLLVRGLPSLDPSDGDRIVINQFINGFSGSHRENLQLLFSGKSPSLTEVVEAAKDIVRKSENECQTFAIDEQSPTTSRLDELSTSLEALSAQVAAIENRQRDTHLKSASPIGGRRRNTGEDWRRRSNPQGRIQCFNCSGFGHVARMCPSPRSARNRPPGNESAGDRWPTAHPR